MCIFSYLLISSLVSYFILPGKSSCRIARHWKQCESHIEALFFLFIKYHFIYSLNTYLFIFILGFISNDEFI